MTIGEIDRACEAYMDRRRDQAYFSYTNALAVGRFVGTVLTGKNVPKMHEIYPELFPQGDEAEEQAVAEAKAEASAANFIKFANSFNRRYDNGNRTTESEDNS